MTNQEELLSKYYKGESTLEEEKHLKQHFHQKDDSFEQDIFGYFESEATIPANLEEDIFAKLKNKEKKGRSLRLRLYRLSSAAAIILLLVSVFIGYKSQKNTQMEDDFFVMEQALFQISESLQPPPEQEEMLVLWVDDNVEIIIN